MASEYKEASRDIMWIWWKPPGEASNLVSASQNGSIWPKIRTIDKKQKSSSDFVTCWLEIVNHCSIFTVCYVPFITSLLKNHSTDSPQLTIQGKHNRHCNVRVRA